MPLFLQDFVSTDLFLPEEHPVRQVDVLVEVAAHHRRGRHHVKCWKCSCDKSIFDKKKTSLFYTEITHLYVTWVFLICQSWYRHVSWWSGLVREMRTPSPRKRTPLPGTGWRARWSGRGDSSRPESQHSKRRITCRLQRCHFMANCILTWSRFWKRLAQALFFLCNFYVESSCHRHKCLGQSQIFAIPLQIWLVGEFWYIYCRHFSIIRPFD